MGGALNRRAFSLTAAQGKTRVRHQAEVLQANAGCRTSHERRHLVAESSEAVGLRGLQAPQPVSRLALLAQQVVVAV
jgi:hypothetical protein